MEEKNNKKFNFWHRHANPASGWSRIATAPFTAAALWFARYGSYTWIPLVIIAIWAIVNPILFRKPKKMNSWISRGVLAEQWWIQTMRKGFIFDYTLICQIIALMAFIPSVVIALLPVSIKTQINFIWAYIFCITIAYVFKMWFVDRVTFEYDKHMAEQKKQESA